MVLSGIVNTVFSAIGVIFLIMVMSQRLLGDDSASIVETSNILGLIL